MSSPISRPVGLRSKASNTTPTDDKRVLQPTPPPGKRPFSASSRPGSRSSPRPGSVSSRTSLPETTLPHRLSRQNSLLTPITNEINYELLPDTTKPASTIGRHHTIVPPINMQNSSMLRPVSRSYSIMAETSINVATSDEFNNDEHAINSVTEENDPTAPLRLENPLVNPRYLEMPTRDLINCNSTAYQSHTPDILPTLPEEPKDGEPRLRLAIKLSNGSRLDRHFRPVDKLQTVLDFVSVSIGSPQTGYTFRSTDSKYKDMASTLEQCQIHDRTLLLLEPPDDT